MIECRYNGNCSVMYHRQFDSDEIPCDGYEEDICSLYKPIAGGGAMSVHVGGVPTWDTGLTPRGQAVKMSEEVMEVFSAIERCEDEDFDPEAWHWSDSMHFRVVDECCDVITATCNLLAKLGVTDLSYHMKQCERRNRARGRL